MALASRIDFQKLMSACVHLSRRGGHIIKEEHKRGCLGAHNKKQLGDERAVAAMEGNELLTVADGRAQDAIVTSLRGMFPSIRLVGEEGEVPSKEAPTSLDEVPLLERFSESHVPAELQNTLTLEDTCLWIDPLDGTKEFVLGNLQNVSVLIGIAVRDRPVAGVLHQPFVGGEEGTVTYGALGVGVFGDREPAWAEPPEDFVLAIPLPIQRLLRGTRKDLLDFSPSQQLSSRAHVVRSFSGLFAERHLSLSLGLAQVAGILVQGKL